MVQDLTPKDFKIIASKNKVVTDDGSEALGGTVGGLGATPVSEVGDVIDEDGNVRAAKVAGTLNGVAISNIPNDAETNISVLDLTHDLAFSSSDADTVAWASGTITFSNGRAFSIDAGNTGDMTALTFIYLDPDVSSTVLQTTATATTAMGPNKKIIAIAQNQTDGAVFQVHGGRGGITLTPDAVITATLSAISANLGTITAGTVTGAILRTASSGARFVMTSNSFQGIDAGDNVVFEVVLTGADVGDVIIGNEATGKYVWWDNSEGELNYTGKSRQTLKLTTIFEDSNRFADANGGTGAISYSSTGIDLRTNTTANSYARTRLGVFSLSVDSAVGVFNDTAFTTLLALTTVGAAAGGNDGNIYVGVHDGGGTHDGTTITTSGVDQYGFLLVKDDGIVSIYATSGKSTGTETQTLLDTIAVNQSVVLSAVCSADSKVTFRAVGPGINASATHTTNVPLSSITSNFIGDFFVNNANTANDYRFSLATFHFEMFSGLLF